MVFQTPSSSDIRGTFRVDGLQTTGDPSQVCPQEKKKFDHLEGGVRREQRSIDAIADGLLNTDDDVIENVGRFLAHVRPQHRTTSQPLF